MTRLVDSASATLPDPLCVDTYFHCYDHVMDSCLERVALTKQEQLLQGATHNIKSAKK